MSFIFSAQPQLWTLRNIETNFGRRQSCMNCTTLTRVRFEVCCHQTRRLVCSSCAETLTGYSKVNMDIGEKYIDSTKAQFRDLKNLKGKYPMKLLNPKVKNIFNLEIGEKKIFITEFDSGRFMMMINDEKITPEADFESFAKKEQVATRAFHFVNNFYIDCMMHFITNGIAFKMP